MEQTNNSAASTNDNFSINSVGGNLRMDELEAFCIDLNPLIAAIDACFEKHQVNEKCISLTIKNGKVKPFITHWEFCALRNSK